MKHVLLLVFLLPLTLTAQTFDGEAGNDWNNPDNWDGDQVPLPSGNVIIPDGFDVVADIAINISSLEIQGTASLTTNNNLVFDGTCTIAQDANLIWNGGALSGPNLIPSVFINDGTININGFLQISRMDFTNNGTINFQSGQQFVFNANATLTNSNTGTIEFSVPGTTSTNPGGGPSNIINNGTVIVSHQNTSEVTTLSSQFTNNNFIDIQGGTLRLFNTFIQLNSGTINIAQNGELHIDNTVNVTGATSGTLDGTINWDAKINLIGSSAFNFTGNGSMEANLANLDGSGTITTNVEVNVLNSIFMLNDAEWINDGTINLEANSNINMAANSRLENTSMGIIDFLGDGASFSVPGTDSTLENFGLIRAALPNATDEAVMAANLVNQNGEIQAVSGILRLGFGSAQLQYQDGVYNVESNATLNFDGNNTISGTLMGSLNGTLNWRGDIYVPVESNLQFSDNIIGTFNFDGFDLRGGGVLFNDNTNIRVLGNSPSSILEQSTIENYFDITILENGNLRIGVDCSLINREDGTIYFLGDNSQISRFGTGNNNLENYGEMFTLEANISARIGAFTTNYGLLHTNDNSEFWFDQSLTNEQDGFIYGDNGTIRLPGVAANFINNGRVSGGNNDEGQLNFINQYTSSPTAVIEVVISGNFQGVDYDYINIQGDAIFEGDIEVFLNEYSPQVGEEFIIATTTGTILGCNIPASVAMPEGGNVFLEYSVECRNNNEVVLTYNGVLNTNEFEDSSVSIYPNPVKDKLYVEDSSHSIETVEIISATGQLISKQKISDNSVSFKTLSPGIYIVKLSGEGVLTTRKIVKL